MNPPRATLIRRFPALASRDFAIFWVGHLLSLIGTSMQNTALPLLAYRISGRPFDLGLIGFATTLPTFFLALPGGVVVEHLDKRKAVIFLQGVMMLDAVVLALLTLAGRIQIWHIFLLTLILGVATAIEITARQSMLIELTGREALPNAIALQSTAFNLSRVIGPALVAPILLLSPENGEGWIFLLNGLSFMTIIISLFFVHARYRVPPEPRGRSMINELREGAQFIILNQSVGSIIFIAAILGIFAFPIIQQLPVVSKDLLSQVGDTKSIVDARNSMLYVSQGAGALIAAFSIAVNSSVTMRASRLLLAEAAFILALLVLPFSKSLLISMTLIAMMGWGGVTQLATMNTLLQLQIPNGLRGRIFSIYLWALQGIAPFGSLLIGWMTQVFGLPLTAITCGAVSLVTIGGIQLFRPVIRREDEGGAPKMPA
jgi:MFS family permease